jgi:penicillin-binding protein 1C
MRSQLPSFLKPQLKRHLKKRWQRLIVKIFLAIFLVGITLQALPYLAPIRAAELRQTSQAIQFRDRNQLLLGTLLSRDQNHTVAVPLGQISPHFIQAMIAAEDQRFYHHGALDERAIGRAVLEALQARQFVSGASTITMQLARMVEPHAGKPLQGKLHEVWTACRLFAGMTRSEILEAYLNRLPMGSNIYGIEAASRIFFGTPASDLNLAQASLLAGLPNDPNALNPYSALDKLKQRQRYVLDRMVQDRFITPEQRDRALNEPLSLQPREQGLQFAPHFQFWLATQLPTQHPAEIQTTLDLPLQRFVESQVQQIVQSLSDHNVNHAAAIVIENRTGEVLAYVGSPNYFNTAIAGQNDGVQALRQPGSTLKPLLYEYALETGALKPNTILPDVPTHYAIPGAKLYSPEDYSETFQGPVRVRFAIANSLNIPAVRTLEKVGVEHFLKRLQQLGFRHLNQPADHYGLGLTLGSGEVSLWELAQAYLTLARGGNAIALQTWKPSDAPSPSQALLHRETAALITDMLSDRHARAKSFGVNSVLALPFAAAVKTGTSSDFRDTWTVGYTQDYTVATWVGNFDNSPMRQVSGVTGAAPLWQRILLKLHEPQEPSNFAPPSQMVKRPICAFSGMRPTTGCPTIVQEYFAPADLAQYDRQSDPIFPADGSINLPAEYTSWLATSPFRSRQKLRILSPEPEDVYILDPQVPQTLQFQLARSSAESGAPTGSGIEWRLNGEKLPTRSDRYAWTMKPGQWTLSAQTGTLQDQIHFRVEISDGNQQRRGFSVRN